MTWPGLVPLTTVDRDTFLDLDESVGLRTSTFRFVHYDGTTGEALGDITPYIGGASLNHDTSRVVKRSVSLSLGIADASVINPLTDRVAIYMLLNGVSWPLGKYMFTSDILNVTSIGNLASVQLVDEMLRIDQAISSPFYSFQDQIPEAVRNLLRDVDDVNLRIEASDLTSAVSAPLGSRRGSILGSLSLQGGYQTPWMDHSGDFRMIRTVDASTAVPSIDFDTEDRIFVDNIVKDSDILDAPNRFIVVGNGNNALNVPVVGSYDVPPSAPHSKENRGFVIPYVTQMQVNTTREAKAAARLIGTNYTIAERVSLSTPPDPRHDSYDVCIFQGQRWLETSWRMTLQEGGSMSHTLLRAYS